MPRGNIAPIPQESTHQFGKKQKIMASCLALVALSKESVLMDCICKGLDGIDQSKSCAADLHSHMKQVKITAHVSICYLTAT